MKILKKQIQENILLHKKILSLSTEIKLAVDQIYRCIKNNGKILICGNGGSAADAQHLAAEFLIRLKPNINRRALPAISLATDTSTLTACGNDIGFEKVFSRTFFN